MQGDYMFTSGKAKDYNNISLNSAKTKCKNGLYFSPQLAAYAFGEKYNGISTAKNREYGAVIIAVNHNGKMAYTWKKTFIGGKKNVVNMWLLSMLRLGVESIMPKSIKKYTATVHTHASCVSSNGNWMGNGTFFFSPNDMKYLPKNKYLVSPDGALHYAEGTPSVFRNTLKGSSRKQKYYEDNGWWYGEILGYGLPFDPICGAYKGN